MIWQVFIATAVIFAVALGGMAIGVIVSNRRLKGTCGGLANMKDAKGNTICDACTKPSPECSGEPTEAAAQTVD